MPPHVQRHFKTWVLYNNNKINDFIKPQFYIVFPRLIYHTYQLCIIVIGLILRNPFNYSFINIKFQSINVRKYYEISIKLTKKRKFLSNCLPREKHIFFCHLTVTTPIYHKNMFVNDIITSTRAPFSYSNGSICLHARDSFQR